MTSLKDFFSQLINLVFIGVRVTVLVLLGLMLALFQEQKRIYF
jgi:hypothetical protein